MGMRVTGLQKAINRFDKLKDRLPDEVQNGLEKSTDWLYTETQKEVPKETHALANTAHFVPHETTGPKRSRGVRYGEPGEGEGVIDYAAAVHEILKAKHAPPTKAKYVEGPLMRGIKIFKGYIKESSQEAVKRAFK